MATYRYTPIPAPVPLALQNMRSQHLNNLTNTPMGVPTQEAAMHPDNFPFIESTTQSTPAIYGVVQIKNVSFVSIPIPIPILLRSRHRDLAIWRILNTEISRP